LRSWSLARKLVALALVCAVIVLGLFPTSRTVFDPLCTYRLNAKVDATIEVGGKLYSSNAIYRASQSREWIAPLNMTGCIETHGHLLVFKLESDAIVLVPIRLCPNAENVFRAAGKSDVVADCENKPGPDRDALALNSGAAPSLWKQLVWGDEVKLVAMTARRSFRNPDDLVDQNAPGVLDASFEETEFLVPFSRRYEKDKPFRFHVARGDFDLLSPK
jgi:hypothetical protein